MKARLYYNESTTSLIREKQLKQQRINKYTTDFKNKNNTYHFPYATKVKRNLHKNVFEGAKRPQVYLSTFLNTCMCT